MKINKTNILMDFFSLIFGFMTFICCFFEMKSVIYIKDKVEKYIIGSDFEPIVNITISRSRCETENGFYPILNYKFKGIDENCYDVNNHKFLNESCTNSDNFKMVNQINERTINIWRERNVCAKKVKNNTDNYTFYFEYNNNANEIDKGDKTYCGYLNNFRDEIRNDSLKIKVYVSGKNNESYCPINFINIYNSTENEIDDDYDNNNITANYEFSDGYILNYSKNNNEGNILTDLIISEDFPCLEKERKSNTTEQFPMLNEIKNFKCNRDLDLYYDYDFKKEKFIYTFDQRFEVIDNVTKYQLFKDNGFDILYNSLPYINNSNWTNDLNSSHFGLFYRSFYLDKDNNTSFHDYHHSIKKLFKLHYARLCINIGNLLILIFFIVILGLIKFVLAICHTLVFFLKLVILFLIFLTNIIIIGYSKNLMSDDVKYFINKGNCYDYNNEDCPFDFLSSKLIKRYNLYTMMDSYDIIIKYEIGFWWAFFSFNLIQAFRLIHKIYIRIKNKKRRQIVKEEIGKNNLKNIMKEFREKKKKKKKQQNLDNSDFL